MEISSKCLLIFYRDFTIEQHVSTIPRSSSPARRTHLIKIPDYYYYYKSFLYYLLWTRIGAPASERNWTIFLGVQTTDLNGAWCCATLSSWPRVL